MFSKHLSHQAEKSFAFIGRNKQNQKELGAGMSGTGEGTGHFTRECLSSWSPVFLGAALKEMLA